LAFVNHAALTALTINSAPDIVACISKHLGFVSNLSQIDLILFSKSYSRLPCVFIGAAKNDFRIYPRDRFACLRNMKVQASL
jgi:hypothetical protein